MIEYMLALTAGVGLGVVFFGGLWITVKRLPYVRHPFLWTGGSYIARLAVCGFCLYLVAVMTQWKGLLMCAAGFFITHLALTRWWGPRHTLRRREP